MSYREPNNSNKNGHNYYDDQVTYDDYYDDLDRYGSRYKEPSRARRIIGKIFCYLLVAVSAFFLFMVYKLGILESSTLIIVGIILLILWLIIFVSQRKAMNVLQAIGMVVAIIASILLAFASYYVTRTNAVLQTVTGRTYDIRYYNVAVRNDDPAQTVADARNYTFAVQSTYASDNLASILKDVEADAGGSITTVDMASSVQQAEALLNGEVDAIIYNDAFTGTIVEQYPEYESQIRLLNSYTLKTESAVDNVDVDVDTDPFLVFISGNDAEGDISLTGRSDVNIVAGINPESEQILLLTIPRDYYVEFPGITQSGSRDKLTHSGIYGMDELLATVENLLGREINYYVRVNFSSLVAIVDAIGGVTIENEQDFISNGGYHYPAGMLDLDGEYTLHYVRERFAFEDGDFARGRNQIKVIEAMMEKLMSVNTLANYNQLAAALSQFAATNIPAEDITDLIKFQISENPQWHVVSYQYMGAVMMQPCQSANGMLLSVDMPYTESIEKADILIEQLLSGEVLSEDLQLEDNGQLHYVTTPVG